jgi:hypothetical protein
MTNYELSSKYEPIVEAGDNGNFSVTKEYTVVRNIPIKTPINGIIIQYVNKTSHVADADGNVYNTTQDIDNLTSDMVKYSNDAYFEIFLLEEENKRKRKRIKKDTADSADADAFQNNSLVRYDVGLEPNTYDINDTDYETFKTEGEINVIGENCFISADNQNYGKILGLPWNYDKDTPANGLPYIPYSPDLYNSFFSSADSNILVHTVNVKWSYIQPKSVVTSNVLRDKPYIVIGGKNLKKKINKSKRKNYTIKRNKKKFTRKIKNIFKRRI